MGNDLLFDKVMHIFILSWRWVIIAKFINWPTLHLKSLTILAKLLCIRIEARSWEFRLCLRDKVASRSFTHFIRSSLFLNHIGIGLIVARPRIVIPIPQFFLLTNGELYKK